MNNKKHMKKGLSLIELIIVLAIIAILTLIVGVAWSRIIYKQRVNSVNSNAKIIFNAAQTEAIKYSSIERTKPSDSKLIGDGDFYFYWDGGKGYSANNVGDLGSTTGTAQDAFGKAVKNILGEETGVFAIYIKNYVVQSVTYSPEKQNRYMGAYPVNIHDTVDTGEFLTFGLTNYTADKIA